MTPQFVRRNKNLFKIYLDDDYKETSSYVDQNYSNALGIGKTGTVSIICPIGWGHSIANTIRRAIIGGAYGCAISAFRIEGFDSPFASCFGFSANAMKISEGLRAIRCHIPGNEDSVVASIHVKASSGAGESQNITAGMFSSQDLIIENPDLVLFSVMDDVDCRMQIFVERSHGYATEDQNRERLSLGGGWFAVSCIYSPVRTVKATSETTSEYDRVTLEVTTVNCSASIEFAAKQALYEMGVVMGVEESDRFPLLNKGDDTQNDTALDLMIEELGLSVKTENSLRNKNIKTVRDILLYSPTELKNLIDGIGSKSIFEIQDVFLNHLNCKEVQIKIPSEPDDVIRVHLYKQLGIASSASSAENIDRIIYNLRSYLIHGEGVETKGKKRKKGENDE